MGLAVVIAGANNNSDIKRALESSISDGCKTIYLTSQDNGCYGFDIKTSLPELLKELVGVKGDYKIRVGMMNPWHLRKIIYETPYR